MNDVIINKIQSIQRCIQRAREEYAAGGDNFGSDYTRQDAAILNITRGCEQAIDLANHVIKAQQLGVPGDSGQSFELLSAHGLIPESLSRSLKKMTGFRNIAVHEYQRIHHSLDDLLHFTELLLPLGG